MSRTLADVEAYQVYLDTDGDIVWRDAGGTVLCRRGDGRISSLGLMEPRMVKITGDSLGHVRDEPWRKADDDETGKAMVDMANAFADLQRRVAELEKRPSVPEGFVKNCADTDHDFERRIEKLEDAATPKIGEVRLQAEPITPPPANPTQPPDVAVYRRTWRDGTWHEEANIVGSEEDIFNKKGLPCHERTVLDAFDRLTWDELRRWNIGVIGPAGENNLWDVIRVTTIATLSCEPSEDDALTAARAIARNEGWR